MARRGGYSTHIEEKRLSTLIRQAPPPFPTAPDLARAEPPGPGLRPATPTGLPILRAGRRCSELWLNLGQGSLGFTLAMGSAAMVAALMAGRPTPIPADGFTLG
jgi:D-amino-acid dehydrogenase